MQRLVRWSIAALVLMLVASRVDAQSRNLKVEAAAAPAELPALADASKPPPTIADLVLLLTSYAPDLNKIERLRAELGKPIPETDDSVDLARAWHSKALIAEDLGDADQHLSALNKALSYSTRTNTSARDDIGGRQRLMQERIGAVYAFEGLAAGIDASEKFIAEFRATSQGSVIGQSAMLARYYAALGSIERAKSVVEEAERIAMQLGRNPWAATYSSVWATSTQGARGTLLLTQGKHEDAERAFLAAIRMAEKAIPDGAANRAAGRPASTQLRSERALDMVRRDLALAYLQQKRLDEAELQLREVLKSALKRDGRNSRMVAMTLAALGRTYYERGRYAEGLLIAEWSARSLSEAGFPDNSLDQLRTKILRVSLLSTLGRHAEAVELFDELQRVAAAEVRQGEGLSVTTLNAVASYLAVGRVPDALALAERTLGDYERFYGVDHYDTAEARAYRAMVLGRSNRSDEARKEFARATAVLIDPTAAAGKQQATVSRTARLRRILDAYLDFMLLAKGAHSENDAAEGFRIADVARWQSVQKAVTGSALRAATGSAELGARIKKVQDAGDELEAVYKNLIGQRSAPPDKQLPGVIAAMEARIAVLQREQQSDLAEIRRQFPQYDALVNPRAANLATARKSLLANEALLSIYVTAAGSYVWATGAQGRLHFHYSTKGADWVAATVKRLRSSVDLAGGIDPGQMRFDMEAGTAIYQELLAPVQGAWEQADTLLVVANEALGQIPFSLLPTAAVAPAKAGAGLPLAEFRQTPWLARKLAVAYLPSISALVTLRSLPRSGGQRDPFIGFGDPDFGSRGDGAGASRGGSRGVGAIASTRKTRNLFVSDVRKWDERVSSLDAAPPAAAAQRPTPVLLPLPDTRDEILAIATALAANTQRDTYFGDRANRVNVLEADLKHRRVLAFATHGLVAGDLPGLDQPALALAPRPGKGLDDGLLKLEDILKLSIDADLVVLSACNTAAADGGGAEAVSGLGRGFFYAGARAVLATHWPVETVSARELVTHLFERYASDAGLTRAQALRYAMLELIDRGTALDQRGKAEFSYAHPAFWAPYALYGDPGR